MFRTLVRSTNSIRELLLWYGMAVLIAAGLFAAFEQRPFAEALWWASVTATTTGYGDIYPETVGGRITAFVLMHGALLLILPLLIGRVIKVLIEDRDRFSHDEQEMLKAQLAAINAKLDRLEGGRATTA